MIGEIYLTINDLREENKLLRKERNELQKDSYLIYQKLQSLTSLHEVVTIENIHKDCMINRLNQMIQNLEKLYDEKCIEYQNYYHTSLEMNLFLKNQISIEKEKKRRIYQMFQNLQFQKQLENNNIMISKVNSRSRESQSNEEGEGEGKNEFLDEMTRKKTRNGNEINQEINEKYCEDSSTISSSFSSGEITNQNYSSLLFCSDNPPSTPTMTTTFTFSTCTDGTASQEMTQDRHDSPVHTRYNHDREDEDDDDQEEQIKEIKNEILTVTSEKNYWRNQTLSLRKELKSLHIQFLKISQSGK